jgi:Co/Zn/Cd efflux system component
MAETPSESAQDLKARTDFLNSQTQLIHAKTILEEAKLANFRAISARWAATVGSLASVSGVFLLIQERDVITGLTHSNEVRVAWLLGAALVGALVATLTTVLLARGDQDKTTTWPWNRKPATLLSMSMTSAALTVILVLASTLVVWFGEREAADEQSYWVYHSNGSISCGKLQRNDDGLLQLDAQSTALTDVTDVIAVDGCPSEMD